MKNRSALSTVRISSSAGLLLILAGTLASVALGQATGNTNAALSPDDRELIRARSANEEAQAEYYREQINKLRQPPQPVSLTGKTFMQSVAENPASLIGVVGTILGAFIVAVVGLTTLYFNNRNAIHAQRDTQFYEAMKRLGDRDSLIMRVSGADLLNLMSQVGLRQLSFRKKWPPLKLARSRPYFSTVVDQLLTVLLLESELVGIDSIKAALQELVPQCPGSITHRLYDAHMRIQEELVSLIASFFVIRGYAAQPPPDDELWERLKDLTGYEDSDLRDLISKSDPFSRRFEDCLRIFQAQGTLGVGQPLSSNHESLRVASSRLRANIDLFCTALESLSPSVISPPSYPPLFSFPRLFLVGGRIDRANLSGINFEDSNFNGTTLFQTNLESTNFAGARLSVVMEGGSLRQANLLSAKLGKARFVGVDMSDASLGYAKTDDYGVSFRDSTWWKASFYNTNSQLELDPDLIEKIFDRFGRDVPSDLNEVHGSVRAFLESRKAHKDPEPG